jgi:GntR family transcriptional regulator of arabinose operon
MSKNRFKYQEFKRTLLEKIRSGELKPGERLVSEPELAENYGISRNTVRQAIKELETEGYLSRTSGKGTFLRAAAPVTSRRIGLIVFDIAYTTHPLTAELIRGAGEILQENGYILDILASERREITETFIPQTADYAGFLIAAYQIDRRVINQLESRNIPHLFVKNYPEGGENRRYYFDYRGAGWGAVEHLAGLGRKRLAVFWFGENYPSSRDFLAGAKAACLEFGCRLKQEHCREVGFDGEGVEHALECVLRDPEDRPRAIVTMEDTVAARVIKYLQTGGLSVPGDVAVTGCNNSEISQLMTPSITTFELPVRQLGKDAALRLIEQLTNPSLMEERCYEPKMIVRDSTGVTEK